ncbi:hypothetical protein C8R43DRAFT_1231436 [Mycena crocata]|nr:hypothetical protein C8R43DRAFT_1231436 [Mycena crocata]
MSSNSLPISDTRTVTPTDRQIRFQFYTIRAQNLAAPLGFQKMLTALKAAEPTWIGLVRLKKILKAIADEEEKEKDQRSDPHFNLTPSHSQALLNQLAWQDRSTRQYRIIGHDGYDYATTPNSDMGILLMMMQKRAIEEPDQRASALYTMWEHLEPVAKKAGVPLENVRQQLWDEYGMDPLIAAPLPARNDAQRAAQQADRERRKANHKRQKMQIMRQMRNQGAPIPIDPITGDIAWADEKHGMFVVLVTRVDKTTGLQEFESWHLLPSRTYGVGADSQ